jgi:hypothetical protein
MARATLKGGLQDFYLNFQIEQADLIGNVDQDFISPVEGYITELGTVVDTAVTTGGTIAVKSGAALATTVAGITQTIANAATKGTRQTTQSTEKSSTRYVAKGERIQLDLTGFATAGGVNGYIKIAAADTDGVMPY